MFSFAQKGPILDLLTAVPLSLSHELLGLDTAQRWGYGLFVIRARFAIWGKC